MDTYIGNDCPGPGEGMPGLQASSFPLSVGVLIGNSLCHRGEQCQGERGLELEAGVGRGLAGAVLAS